jgi:hypothetical protein
MAFMYHRLYDAVLLALPLVHAAVRRRASAVARARQLYAVAAAAITLLLFVPEDPLWLLTRAHPSLLVQALVLPAPFYLLLAALAALDVAGRLERRQAPAG